MRADEKCLCVEGARRDGPFVYRFEDIALRAPPRSGGPASADKDFGVMVQQDDASSARWRSGRDSRWLHLKYRDAVGSTPTGASLEAMIRPGQRRTSPRPYGGRRRVFRTWVLTDGRVNQVSSVGRATG